ncbi:glycosyltransferase family 52 [Providencia rettgeri]|nr:glycosyltransferase family 52 [Providencia rettgeri]
MDNDSVESTKKIKKNKTVNIFVGSRFKDILQAKTSENLNSLIAKIDNVSNKYDDVMYLRHPRELSENSFNMIEHHIETISEDYIYKLAEENNSLNILGFGSTCQLNVMNIPNVSVVLLQTKLIRNDILDSFGLFKSPNVTIFNID